MTRTAPQPITALELEALVALAGEPQRMARFELAGFLTAAIRLGNDDAKFTAIIVGSIQVLQLLNECDPDGYTVQIDNAEVSIGNMGWFHDVPLIVHGLEPHQVLLAGHPAAATALIELV